MVLIITRNNIRLVTGMAILCLFLLASTAGASPPPALLEINGKEQSAGIGSNCWKVENETYSLCTDMIGIITPAEPLLTRSPFRAHLLLPLQEPPEELEISIFQVTDNDELKEAANGVRAWRFKGNAINNYKRPFEREAEFNLSLPPGLYVFNVFAKWEGKGDESYGFLVQVEGKNTNNVSSIERTAGFELFPAITALFFVILIRKNKPG